MKKLFLTLTLIFALICAPCIASAAAHTTPAAEYAAYAEISPAEATPAAGYAATTPARASIDLTPILKAIIALLASLITYKLIPWISSKTTEKQRENLEAAVKVAVYAAEQIYGAGDGEKKLDYALNKLREAGFNIDKEMLREAVEAAVYAMKNPVVISDGIEISGSTAVHFGGEDDEDAAALPPLKSWPLEAIIDFCKANGIPCDGCQTKTEYINAIKGGRTEPPDTAPATDE